MKLLIKIVLSIIAVAVIAGFFLGEFEDPFEIPLMQDQLSKDFFYEGDYIIDFVADLSDDLKLVCCIPSWEIALKPINMRLMKGTETTDVLLFMASAMDCEVIYYLGPNKYVERAYFYRGKKDPVESCLILVEPGFKITQQMK